MVVPVPESLVKFVEGEQVRVLRGIVGYEDDTWLTLQRRDAVYRIKKSGIILIETLEVES